MKLVDMGWIKGMCHAFDPRVDAPFRFGQWLCATDGTRILALQCEGGERKSATELRPYLRRIMSVKPRNAKRVSVRKLREFCETHRQKQLVDIAGVAVDPQKFTYPLRHLSGYAVCGAVKINFTYPEKLDAVAIDGRDWRFIVMRKRGTASTSFKGGR